jgi:16S rRNA (guanine(966)-N(2))-methyltransferase RsmD
VKAAVSRAGPGRKAPQQVRIIGGQWRRSLLPVVEGEGLRPTPDRVRETLFNWLGYFFDGAWEGRDVLDLFAGSGALGLEAASRGARSVTLVDSFTPALRALQQVKDKLGAQQVQLQRADARQVLGKWPSASLDLIFLDPPYALDLLPSMLDACGRLLKPQGLVYAESDRAFPDSGQDWLQAWEVLRTDRAGAVHYCLLRCTKVA